MQYREVSHRPRRCARPWRSAAVACASILLAAPAAYAQSEASPAPPTVSAAPSSAPGTGALTAASLMAPSIDLDANEADIRTAWIQARLDAETPAAQRWYWIFLPVSLAATAGQFALGAIMDTNQKASWYVGAVNAAIGTLPMIIVPFAPAFAAGRLRGVTARTPQERIARMHRAEAILRDSADSEAFGSSWVLHAAGVVLGVGSTVVLGMGYQQQWFPLPPNPDLWIPFNLVSNLLVTIGFNELQVLSQPTQLIRDRETYDRDHWRMMASATRPRNTVRWSPVVLPGGVGVAGMF